MFIPIGDDENRPGGAYIMVIAIIAINVAVFVAEAPILSHGARAADALFRLYGASPSHLAHHPEMYWTTIFSSMFMHGSPMHLLGNMLFLWIFADNIEDLLGSFGFVIFYLMCGVAAVGAHVISAVQSTVPVVGASGAISGVLGAYILMFPRNTVRNFYWFFWIFVGVARLPAWIYLGFWFGMQLMMAASHDGSGVAFVAHVGGFIAGMVLIVLFPKRQEAIDYYRWSRSA